MEKGATSSLLHTSETERDERVKGEMREAGGKKAGESVRAGKKKNHAEKHAQHFLMRSHAETNTN